MEDEKKPITGTAIAHRDGANSPLKDLFIANPHPPGTVFAPPLKKRPRRKGYLNDGQWAPGHGPNDKKPKG